MVKTSHAGLYSTAAIVIGAGLTSICGHPIDVSSIEYPALITTIATTIFGLYKEHIATSGTDPLAVQ